MGHGARKEIQGRALWALQVGARQAKEFNVAIRRPFREYLVAMERRGFRLAL